MKRHTTQGAATVESPDVKVSCLGQLSKISFETPDRGVGPGLVARLSLVLLDHAVDHRAHLEVLLIESTASCLNTYDACVTHDLVVGVNRAMIGSLFFKRIGSLFEQTQALTNFVGSDTG